MDGEVLQQFMSMTGADTDFALSFLEANAWNLESAINLYLEGNFGAAAVAAPASSPPTSKAPGGAGGGSAPARVASPPLGNALGEALEEVLGNAGLIDEQGGGGSLDPRTLGDEEMARAMSDIPPEMYENTDMYDDDGVRAPILPKSEILVEDDPYIRQPRLRPPRGEANVFDMFRDYRHESMVARGGDDQSTKKIKTLADLFRPPVDLLEAGSFENVKNVANQRKKWLLVNIQETSEFDCQKMNRDTWADAAVKSVVRTNFVLWQVLKTSEEGMRYCRFYPIEIVPHLAIIDSRTGERLDVREGFIEPKDLVIVLEQFLAANSLDDNRPTNPQPESPPPKRLGDLSEEAQLAAAVAASLGREAGLQEDTKPHATPTTTTTSTTTTSTHTPAHPPPSEPTKPAIATPAASTTTPVSTPQPPKEEPQPAQPSPTLLAEHSAPSAECNCTIQIRMPSEAIKGHFRPTDTLRTVHQYVSLHLNPRKDFVLVSTFPKKTYSGEQLDITLKQADLVPRAVLICELVME